MVIGGPLTGALVGKNEGYVTDCFVTGVVRGQDHTGGLIGHNNRLVNNCHYEGNVEGQVDVGGLCGSTLNYQNLGAQVESSTATATVLGVENVGGLIGANQSHSSRTLSCHATSDVSGTDRVGGLVGFNRGNVEESYSISHVEGETKVGGLVGASWEVLRACMCSGQVSGRTDVGGLLGYNYGSITSCYTTSGVSGGDSVGGLIGRNFKGTATYCYAAGPVMADGHNVGGLIGLDHRISAEQGFFLCYWDTQTSGLTSSQGGFGRPTELMRESGTFRGWAETELWTILEGADYPRLAWEQRPGQPITNMTSPYGGGTGDLGDPYQIWTATQFIEIAYQPGDFMRSFILMVDIDLADIDTNEILPIGSSVVSFMGAFDGNGHTIANFRCVCPGSPYTGVFGFVGWPGTPARKPTGATGAITNLNLANAYVSGGSSVGALAGASTGHISHVSVTGHIEGGSSVGGLVGYNKGALSASSSSVSVSGEDSVGGLVGYTFSKGTSEAITECHSAGTVYGRDRAGGLIGYNHDTIEDCASDCNVTGTTDVGGLIGFSYGELSFCHATGQTNGHSDVGGLVGHLEARLRQCHTTGPVTADGDRIGGLVGRSWSSPIRQSYSLSSVAGHDAVGGLVGKTSGEVELSYARGNVRGNDFVGGLIGVSSKPVIGCYSTGGVVGNTHVGGFFGRCWYGQVGSCFWDILTSGQTIGNGYYPNELDGLMGLPTAQMQIQQTYLDTGWDLIDETENGTDDIWWILEGQDYPRLWWELIPEN
jgi:hypothetical protein